MTVNLDSQFLQKNKKGPDCECIGKTQKKGPDCEHIGTYDRTGVREWDVGGKGEGRSKSFALHIVYIKINGGAKLECLTAILVIEMFGCYDSMLERSNENVRLL